VPKRKNNHNAVGRRGAASIRGNWNFHQATIPKTADNKMRGMKYQSHRLRVNVTSSALGVGTPSGT
jgi:hypothetical protein